MRFDERLALLFAIHGDALVAGSLGNQVNFLHHMRSS